MDESNEVGIRETEKYNQRVVSELIAATEMVVKEGRQIPGVSLCFNRSNGGVVINDREGGVLASIDPQFEKSFFLVEENGRQKRLTFNEQMQGEVEEVLDRLQEKLGMGK